MSSFVQVWESGWMSKEKAAAHQALSLHSSALLLGAVSLFIYGSGERTCMSTPVADMCPRRAARL